MNVWFHAGIIRLPFRWAESLFGKGAPFILGREDVLGQEGIRFLEGE